jgi:serine/threonine-protein kinase RsbW
MNHVTVLSPETLPRLTTGFHGKIEVFMVLSSALEEIPPFLERLQSVLWVCDFLKDDLFAIRLAVEEALINAIKHGNQLYRSRRVRLHYSLGMREFRIRIEDEGTGFNPAAVPDPTDPEHLERTTGRGLLLMRHFMHTVRFNAKGNAVTLVRQRQAGSPPVRLEANTENKNPNHSGAPYADG